MKKYTSKAGRSNIYDFDFEVSEDIKTIQSLIEALEKPHILTTEWHPISSPVYPDYNFIWTDMLKHILGEYEEILAASDEDVAWTEQRNKDYLYVAFRKVTFKPETQKRLRAYLQEYKDDLTKIYEEWAEEERQKAEAKKARLAQWHEVEVYELIKPRGGELGTDGYKDALYSNGKTQIRAVSRDIFDFGKYHYPKRLAGMKDVVNRSEWTEEEASLIKWLVEFGEFRGSVRM